MLAPPWLEAQLQALSLLAAKSAKMRTASSAWQASYRACKYAYTSEGGRWAWHNNRDQATNSKASSHTHSLTIEERDCQQARLLAHRRTAGPNVNN